MRQMGTKARVLTALLGSFLIAGIYFVAVYQNIPFIYDINDDVAMRNVAAGVITGTPDAHLIHIKYLLGLLISGMYRLVPGLDWYGLVLIGIILFSFSMILYRGMAERKGWVWKLAYVILSLLLFTGMGLFHVTAFQWTTAAAIPGAAGIYLFYTSETKERFQMFLEEGISVFLILLSLAIRDDVFLMVLPIAGLAFWWRYGSLKRKGKLPVTLDHIWVPAGLLAGTLLLLGTEAAAYHSPQWKEFRTYNVNREAIMDYYGLETYQEDPDFFDSLDISPEEAENLKRYSLYLVKDLYSEKMAALAEHFRDVYLEQHSFGERMSAGIEKLYEHLGKDTYHSSNLLCLCMIALTLGLCAGKSKRHLELAGSMLAVWVLYWMYLGYRNRIIERVGFALYLLAFLSMLAVWYRTSFLESREEEKAKEGISWTKFLMTAGIGILLFLNAAVTWKAVEGVNTWRRDYNLRFLEVNRYMEEHKENVYFMTTFSIETYTDNFTVRRNFAFSNLLSVGGWHTFSPLENEKKDRLGIGEPKEDICRKENVYVISLENVNLRYMERYFESLYGENYGGSERIDVLDYGDQKFEVYDFSLKEEKR